MKTYTKQQFISYICGWLGADDANNDQLSLNNMKAALNNALVCISCPSDGIENHVERLPDSD
jgi:hypothetical protein